MGVTIKTSKTWDTLTDPKKMETVIGMASELALKQFLVVCTVQNLADLDWDTTLESKPYMLFKSGAPLANGRKGSRRANPNPGKAPIADLFFSGDLRREVAVNAPKAIERKGMSAFTKLDANRVPYAAAHQFGYEKNNLKQRMYLNFDKYGKRVVKFLGRKLKQIVKRGK